MRIKFWNLSNPTTVSFPVIIVKGCVENYTKEVWDVAGTSSFLILHHQSAGEVARYEEVLLQGLQFKILLRLQPGENVLTFDFLGVKDTLRVWYTEVENEYDVKLVYIVPNHAEPNFQGPEECDCSLDSAKQRIYLAGELLQSIMAETLWEEGLGRKTFILDTKVHVLNSKLSTEECWSLGKEELWEYFAREIMQSSFKHKKSKYLAFLSCTRYQNPEKIKPDSFSEVASMTKGYVALGGGGLALFGSGSLWTWPTHLSKVQTRLLNEEKINTDEFMDDSAYRGTVGAMFATTLGSVLHELGHCFDLGHSSSGIMARGFDDLDQYLTLTSRKKCRTGRSGLAPCSAWKLSPDSDVILEDSQANQDPMSPRFTSIRRTESVSKYLENYARRRIRSETYNGCGVHWREPFQNILAKQKWMQISQCENKQVYLPCIQTSVCCHPDLLEIRESGGKSLRFWSGSEVVSLSEIDIMSLGCSIRGGVLVTGCGQVLKIEIDHQDNAIHVK